MEKFKSWLKSWIFWLIVSVILLAVFIFLISDWMIGDDRLFVLMLLIGASIVMLLINIPKENLMKVLLTVLVSSFSVLLLFLLASILGISPDFFEGVLLPLLFALIIISWPMVLLKLIWKNKLLNQIRWSIWSPFYYIWFFISNCYIFFTL